MRANPAQAVRETAEVIKELLRGEKVHSQGKTVTLQGADLGSKMKGEIPLYLASRSPLILREAGRIADGVILGDLISQSATEDALDLVTRIRDRFDPSKDGNVNQAAELVTDQIVDSMYLAGNLSSCIEKIEGLAGIVDQVAILSTPLPSQTMQEVVTAFSNEVKSRFVNDP